MSANGAGRHNRRPLSWVERVRRFPSGETALDWFATEPEPFEGPVGIGETYLGGRKRNIRVFQRRLEQHRVAGKVAVGGILGRPTNQITATVLPNSLVRTIQSFVCSGAHRGATFFTDEATACRQLPEFGRTSACHTVVENVRARAYTNGFELFWAILKGDYVGTHHHMRAKHLGHRQREFAGRRRLRDADTTDPTVAMASSFLGRPLRYAKPTA